MSEKHQHFIQKSILLYSSLILFLPLVISGSTFFPYIFGKMLVFQVLVELQVAFWLPLAVLYPAFRPKWKHPLFLCLAAWMAVLLLTSLTSVDALSSFWSSQERMTGFVSLIHLWLWFLVLTSTLSSWKQWRQLVLVSIIASFCVGLYGLAQLAHLPIVLPNVTDTRLASTLGNPIYLGIYAMIHLFLSLILFVREKGKGWKIFFIISFLFNALILLLAYSRGSLFITFFSLALFGILAIFLHGKPQLKQVGVPIFIAFIVVSGALFVWFHTPSGEGWAEEHLSSELKRIVASPVVDQNRVGLWELGLQGFRERPFFGWGIENYNAIYAKYALPEKNGIRLQEAWFDRSHNQIVDILALTGVIGFVCYVALWSVLLVLLFRLAMRKRDERGLSGLLLFSVLIGYFIQNLTVFDSTVPLITFYFLLALAFGLLTEELGEKKSAASRAPSNSRTPYVVAASALVFIAVCYSVNYLPYAKSSTGIRSLELIGRYPESAQDLFRESLNTNAYVNQEIRRALADSLTLNQANVPKEFLYFTAKELEKSISEHPYEIRNYQTLSRLYRLIGYRDAPAIQKAIDVMKESMLYAPNRVDNYYELSTGYVFAKDQKQFKETLDAAERLDPLSGKPDWFRALGYEQFKKFDEVLPALLRAEEKGLSFDLNPNFFLFFAKDIPSSSLDKKLLSAFDGLSERHPANMQLLVARVALHIKYGDAPELLARFASQNAGSAELLRTRAEQLLSSPN